MEEAEVPALCERVRHAREATIDPATGRRMSQERAAALVGVSVRAYRKWETTVEPKPLRLRQIAAALGLPEDHFLPSENVASATARLEAESDRIRVLGDQFEELLEVLRTHIEETSPARPRRGRT